MRATIGRMLVSAWLSAAASCGCLLAQQDKPIEDKEINVIQFEAPVYPALALQTRTQGLVVVRARLDSAGKVIDANALSGSRFLVEESIANIRKWRFEPSSRQVVVMVYRFTLSPGMCKAPSGFFELQRPNLATVTACPYTIQP